MPRAKLNGVELEYQVFGEGQPLLLVQGLGAQMVLWDEHLCAQFVERGFQVIRFDNRDIGLSSKIEDDSYPDVRLSIVRAALGKPVNAPYTLSEMADDAVALLDHLGIEKAMVYGLSMGGMIAQTIAIRHPERVHGLVSQMSSPGGRSVYPKPRALLRLVSKPQLGERDMWVESMVTYFGTMRGPRFDPSVDRLRVLLGQCWDRGLSPKGAARQLLAVLASGDRTAALKELQVPGLVIHGTADPLIPMKGGVLTARAIPDSRLVLIPGMGHYMPQGAWPKMIWAVTRFADELKQRA